MSSPLDHLSWIAKLLTTALVSAPSTLQIDARVHITGTKGQIPELKSLDYDSSNTPPSPSDASDEGKKLELANIFTAFKTKHGRPDIIRMLNDVVASSSGPVSVDGE